MPHSLEHVRTLTEKKHGELEHNQFYNILALGIKIETASGFKPVKSFVIKPGTPSTVMFDTGEIVECSLNHIFMTPDGQKMTHSLSVGDHVITRGGVSQVSSIVIANGETKEFYDIEVESDEHTFLTADGICHHNTGKTQTVEDMLHAAGKTDGSGYFKITGSATPTGIYRILYTHRKEILLFDDSDSALADQEGRNLFKAASDTKKVRKISWMKGGKNFVDPDEFDEDADDDTLPRYFDFTGKIIFISNLQLNKLDPDGALRTRGYVINVDPTNEEIYDFMVKIADKIPLDVNYDLSSADRYEVIDILRSRRIADKSANLRSLVRGLNTRAGVEQQGGTSDEWKKFVKMFA